MPKLSDLQEHLSPKVVGAVVTGGFAAAGLAAVIGRQLRILGKRDTPLADRLAQAREDSLGTIRTGPSGLVAHGRDLVAGGRFTGDVSPAATPAESEPAPDRRPSAMPTDADGQAPAKQAPAKKQTAKKQTAKQTTAKQASAKKPTATEQTAEKQTSSTEPSSAEEPVPARAIDTSQPNAEQPSAGADAGPERKPGGGDTRAELEELTFAELKDRASQRQVPGRSKMNKDQLVEALLADDSG